MTAAASTGRRRCRRGDESGSTLILALVFISLFGLFIEIGRASCRERV